MHTLQIEMDEQTYQALSRWAKHNKRRLEDAALDAIDQVVSAQESDEDIHAKDPEDKIRSEAASWRAMPQAERHRYSGQFVAVHEGRVIDHDSDRRHLYLRVREKLGDTPVLITSAEEPSPREYRIRSPRISTEP
jgi:hypothetical protein